MMKITFLLLAAFSASAYGQGINPDGNKWEKMVYQVSQQDKDEFIKDVNNDNMVKVAQHLYKLRQLVDQAVAVTPAVTKKIQDMTNHLDEVNSDKRNPNRAKNILHTAENFLKTLDYEPYGINADNYILKAAFNWMMERIPDLKQGKLSEDFNDTINTLSMADYRLTDFTNGLYNGLQMITTCYETEQCTDFIIANLKENYVNNVNDLLKDVKIKVNDMIRNTGASGRGATGL